MHKLRSHLMLIFLPLLLVLKLSFAQDEKYPAHERTQAPADSRFEIIQSSLAAKITLKLDKFTGDTFQMIQKANGDWVWERLSRMQHKEDTIKNNGKVNYQVFTSGKAVKYTFLLNVNTGATWSLSEDSKKGVVFWSPIE